MSKKWVKRAIINGSEEGISVSRMMLLTCAREFSTNKCCGLYAFEGSDIDGRMLVMSRLKISYVAISIGGRYDFYTVLTDLQLLPGVRCIWRAESQYFH